MPCRVVCLVTAALLLICSEIVPVSASGHYALDLAANSQQRGLLQAKQLDCSRVHAACSSCRFQRIPGTRRSQLVCSVCRTGYRLRRDGKSKTCDCAPGLAFDENGICKPCPVGKWCGGGDLRANPNNEASDCPEGLQTIFAGAKSQAQCFTQPGYGRVSIRLPNGMTTLGGQLCEIGTYNWGSNAAGCQRCGPGLTTEGRGANSSEACLAPAGSYLDKGIGKLCQKGTYSTDSNSSPFCIPCPEGITTPSEGSTSADNCTLALKGYFISDTINLAASQCPADTYNDQEAAVTECTPCPYGWRTKDYGATGVAMCLAPPGFELVEGSEVITECVDGWYKADWNRNPCLPCGSGLVTLSTGAVSRDECMVPAGYGIIQYNPLAAAPCAQNTYGDSVPRAAVSNARCTACPVDMYTSDSLEGVPRAVLGVLYTSQLACMVMPGWGTTNTLPQRCPVGTYNEGKNRQFCRPCPAGYTTTGEGKTNSSLCVIQPGWKLGADGLPAPCDIGTYSAGGTDEAPHAQCQICQTGFTTQQDESTRQSDCELCAPGFGGSGCQICPYGTFSQGSFMEGVPCSPCASGTVSIRGATQSQQCLPELVDASDDVWNLADESAWVAVAGVMDSTTCGSICSSLTTCIMYRFAWDGADNQCQLFHEDPVNGDKIVGFKVGQADDYVTYIIPGNQVVGLVIESISGPWTEVQCMSACTSYNRCELYMVSAAGECQLAESELDSDYASMVSVKGDHLYRDRSAVTGP